MRAFAVVIVMLYHLGAHLGPKAVSVHGGYIGVDIFFVLSGFLITTLLISERDRHRKISFKRFYERRALRLFPALGLLIVAVVVAGILSPHKFQQKSTLDGLPWVILYVGNWDHALVDPNSLGLLSHTWSLAVEEQFYILWPALFILISLKVRNDLRAGFMILALAGVDIVYRSSMFAVGWSEARIYNGLDTHADGLLIGCGIAFLWSAGYLERLAKGRVKWIGGVACVAILLAAVGCRFGTVASLAIAMTVGSVGTGCVLVSMVVAPIKPVVNVLDLKPVAWLGRRSYGLYLWHYPVAVVIENGLQTGSIAQVVLAIAISLALTVVSWRLVEAPALKLKERLGRASLIQTANGPAPA